MLIIGCMVLPSYSHLIHWFTIIYRYVGNSKAKDILQLWK